jgi:uncharacterized protein (TIGR02453 family)
MSTELQLTLDILREMRANNNKTWFEANRKRYDQARAAYEKLIAELIAGFQDRQIEDLSGVTVKDCVFRIYRDVRFSKDKSPFNTHMGGVIAQGGRKPQGRSYYIHVEPDGGSFMAGGLYDPTRPQLDYLRQHIAENADSLRAIITAPDFIKYFGGLDGETLKTAPQGYAKDHPAIDLLRYKQFLASHKISDADLVSDDLVPRLLDVAQALRPFLTYFNELLAGVIASPSRY